MDKPKIRASSVEEKRRRKEQMKKEDMQEVNLLKKKVNLGKNLNGPDNPPPYEYPSPGPPPAVVTTIVPGAIIIRQNVGPEPTRTTCQSCNEEIVTRIDRKPTMRTHLFAALLCLFVCWPCVCIPYCMDSCLSVDHFCTNCGAFVGTYNN